MQGQGAGRVDVEGYGLSLTVGQLAFPRPSPAQSSVTIPNVERALHPDVEPPHHARDDQPHQAEAVPELLHALV